MTKGQICITIPIYKETLNDFEVQSVRQCIEVLSGYTIYFVCANNLNKKFYKEKFKEIKQYVSFDAKYFQDLKGYNELMLNYIYYSAFSNYKYMLLYQTDSYVFKDELLNWANKGYDYIGGLLFEGFHGNPDEGAKLWCAGNGGFSLRNISAIVKVLKSKKKLKNKKELEQERKRLVATKGIKRLKYFILFSLKRLGYKNSVGFYAKNFDNNEDVFLINLSLRFNLITMPIVEEALNFAWDRRPDYMYGKLGELPFGCHAWNREDMPYEGNKNFWTKFINKKNLSNANKTII